MAGEDLTARLRVLGQTTFSSQLDRAGRSVRGVGTEARTSTRHVGLFGRSTASASRGTNALRGSMRAGVGGFRVFGAGIAGVTGLLGAAGLAGVLHEAATQFQEAVKVGAQTTAVLKSTGGAANVTARHISRLADAISRKVGIDGEAIQSSENMLLTFTGVRNEVGKGNDIFDRATRTVTDMSVALGQDAKSSAIQLGKALNDPIKGITALTRVGVTFTDKQKEQIKTLVESGQKLKAQKIILGELNKEFGGSAAAAATPWDKLRVAWGDLAQAIGGLLAPAVNKVLPPITHFINQMVRGRGAGGQFVKGLDLIGRAKNAHLLDKLRAAFEKIGPFLVMVGKGAIAAGKQLIEAFKPAMPFVKNVLLPLLKGIAEGVIGSVVLAFKVAVPVIKVFATALGWLGEKLKPLGGVFEMIGKIVGLVFGGVILRAISIGGKLGMVIRGIGHIVAWVARPVVILGAGVVILGKKFLGVAQGPLKVIGDVLRGFGHLVGKVIGWFKKLGGAIGTALSAGVGAAKGIFESFIGFFQDRINNLIDIINAAIKGYNAIPLAPNIGLIGHVGSGGSQGPAPRDPGAPPSLIGQVAHDTADTSTHHPGGQHSKARATQSNTARKGAVPAIAPGDLWGHSGVGDVYLDSRKVGKHMSRQMATDAGRA